MSSARSRILADIAQTLARHSGDASPPPMDSPASVHLDSDIAGSETTLRRFAENLAKVGGECHILNDEEAALSQLRGILGECHGQSVLVPPDAELDRMGVVRIVQETGCMAIKAVSASIDVASKSAIGITVAFGGIADTGTVVLVHATLDDQLSALLPPVHVAILRKHAICPDKRGLLATLMAGGINLSSAVMTWVTGPSLTADIEKVLVRGAHGPRRVIALVF